MARTPPTSAVLEGEAANHDGWQATYYKFKPSLRDDMQRASLIITHAGFHTMPTGTKFFRCRLNRGIPQST